MTLRLGEVYFSEQDSSLVVPESISLFGLSISFYGLFLVLAALVGFIFVKETSRRKKLDTEKCVTLLTLIIVSAIIGARVQYVLFDWQRFVHNPISVLQFRNGGLCYFGALFGAWFSVRCFCRKTKTDFFAYADTLCMGGACAAPLVWMGCAFVREPLGRFYDGLFSVKIEAQYLTEEIPERYLNELTTNAWEDKNSVVYVRMHPVAIYGILLSLIVLATLCICWKKKKTDGTVFSVYLVMNAVLIFILEMFRGDSAYVWGTEVPVNHVVSGVIVVTIVWGKLRQFIKKRKNGRMIFVP